MRLPAAAALIFLLFAGCTWPPAGEQKPVSTSIPLTPSFSPSPSNPVPAPWTDVTGPVQGFVRDIKFEPGSATNVYVATAEADSGNTGCDINRCPSYIYHTTGGFFASTDGGKTWAPRNHGLVGGDQETVLHIVTEGGGRLVALTGHGVFWSGNSGNDWHGPRPLPDGAKALAEASDGTLYAGMLTRDGSALLYKSADDGRSWNRSDSGLPSPYYHPPCPNCFSASGHGGNPGYWEAGEVAGVVVAPSKPTTLYAWTFGVFNASDSGPKSSLFRSDDGAVTWHETGVGLPPVVALAIHPNDPQRAWAATGAASAGGLFRTMDGGHTWEEVARGTTMAVAVLANGTLIAGGEGSSGQGGGVRYSADAGDSWHEISDGVAGRMMDAFAFDGAAGHILVAGHAPNTVNGPSSAVYRTETFGR